MKGNGSAKIDTMDAKIVPIEFAQQLISFYLSIYFYIYSIDVVPRWSRTTSTHIHTTTDAKAATIFFFFFK